ncbi:MAG TPA: hypothetical protein VFG00_15085, partial [Acidothermaceae bacterium]|nr:hypothetical protein [Acidothermaceae bacterium]
SAENGHVFEHNSPSQQTSGPRGRWWRRVASTVFSAPAAVSRRLPGRPLTLALGWFLSCVVITAVTLTAVEQVGREVSGSQGLITTQAGIKQQVAAQSASAASAASASSALPVQPPASVATAVLPTSKPTTPVAPPSHTPSAKPSVTPTTSPPTVPISAAPVSSPTPVVVKPPPGATEYIYVCRAGQAVGGAVEPSLSPSPTPSATPTPSTSISPAPTVTPTGATSTSPSPSPTPTTSTSATPTALPTASGSPVTSKNFIFVKLGTPLTTIGQINIACSGDSIANANATTSGKGYTLTVRSTSNPQVDVFFSKN